MKVWDAVTGAEQVTLKGHTQGVTSVCFSPDSRRLASASLDNTVKIWDPDTGVEMATLKGHSPFVTSVCFSPDGRRLASGSYDQTVKVWDAETGVEKITLEGHTQRVTSVCFSPDGHRLASASFDNVKVWDAETGAEYATLKGHTQGLTSVSFNPDGQRLAFACDRTVKVWSAERSRELTESPDWDWRKLGRMHPTKPIWVHLEDEKPILINLDLSESELAYRRSKAMFKPFEVEEEYKSAKTPYAKAFWKGRFAFNLPDKSEYWNDFRAECLDEATYRLMKQTCDLVLQKGPNEMATKQRQWAIEQLAKVPERLPMPRVVRRLGEPPT